MKRTMFAAAIVVAGILSAPAIAAQCYESSIVMPSPFMGNNDEIFKLHDGSLWVVKYEYSYMYEYYPNVIICPDSGKLHVKGKALSVELVGGTPGPRRQR